MTCGFTSQRYEAVSNASYGALIELQWPGNPLQKDSLTKHVELFTSGRGPFCDEFENKEYLAHVNTPNVAKDFDLIRNLTGWEMLDYWGFSYGTILGAIYANSFPDRVGKMVLDGFNYYR
jgi:pimeloyl-ACP methyl ester carboxylesterase